MKPVNRKNLISEFHISTKTADTIIKILNDELDPKKFIHPKRIASYLIGDDGSWKQKMAAVMTLIGGKDVGAGSIYRASIDQDWSEIDYIFIVMDSWYKPTIIYNLEEEKMYIGTEASIQTRCYGIVNHTKTVEDFILDKDEPYEDDDWAFLVLSLVFAIIFLIFCYTVPVVD